MKLGEFKAMEIEAIPTGALSLDIALGIGGVPRGRIIEVFGPESSGKTTLALHIIAEAQKIGGEAAFIDAEHALDPVYAKKLGVDIDNLIVSQPDTGEQALEITESLVRSGALDVIVVDSVAALVPKAEIDGDMGDSHMGLQARLMSQALRKLAGAINKSKTVLIFINQLREKIGVMFGNPETTTGGRALKFYASVRMDIRKIENIKQDGEVKGNRVRVKEIKNKYIERYFKEFKEKLYNKNINDESYQLKRVPRKPTTNEVKFRRFVKARISEMLNPKYIELVGAEHYLGSILVLNEIFDKYTLREKVEGLFENEYIIDVKTKLLHNLLNMNFENLKEEIIEDTKIICIQTIMENKYFNRVLENNYKIENKNRAILEELNKAFNVRENFEKYVIYAMDKINLYEEEMNCQMKIKYVNDLFGYKTEKQLKEQLIKEFGSSVKIEQKENSLIIKIATDNIGKYMKINENLINEVINHCEHYHKELDKIIIEIENIRNDYKLDADPAHYLIYNVDVLQRSYVQLIKRKSGQEDKKKYFTLK